MKSRQEFVYRALQNLGVSAAGEAPAAEDAKIADDAVEPLLSNLAQRGVWQWGDPDQIDDDAFLPLARLLANECAETFGKAPDEGMRLLNESKLLDLVPAIDAGDPIKAEYF